MTILVHFHHKQYKNFKAYYQDYVCCHLRWAFPNLVSYSRFVQLSQEVLVPLSIFLNTRFGECSGISFVDSTPLPVCHNRRISAHRVFTDYAERSKTSMGWFYQINAECAYGIQRVQTPSCHQRPRRTSVSYGDSGKCR